MDEAAKSGSMVAIGDVSKATGLPVSTIRFYEKEFGSYLQVVKSSGGHRRFCGDDVEKLKYIHDLVHNKGKSLKEVKTTLVSDRDPALLRRDMDLLLEVFEKLVQENCKLRTALQELNKRVLSLEEEKGKKRFKIF